MFHSITFNGTDKKPIGTPIIRKTNKMIKEFDLQYERNYKIIKIKSQREKEFQEYLKLQEELEFRRENFIKLLKGYFLENNYNSDSFYNLYKHPIIPTIKRKKRKIRVWPKTARIRRNKNLFYRITINNFFYNKFNPYLLPLTNQDKKIIERKIITDPNIKKKEDNSLTNMTPAQLKKFVDVYGFIPSVYKRKDKEKKKNKKIKKIRNFSTNNIVDNKNSKFKISIKLKKVENDKLLEFGNKYNSNNSNTYNNFINNCLSKRNNSINSKNYKYIVPINRLNRYNSLSDKMKNNLDKIYTKSNSCNNKYNNRYSNINNNNKGNYSNLNSINSQNRSLFNNTNNNFFIKNNNSIPSTVRIERNIKIGNFKRHASRLKNKCIKTIRQSEFLNKDIKFFNKIYKFSADDFKNKEYQIQKKGLKLINYINYMKIYQKDFKPDVKKDLEKKYQYIREDLKGNIQLNKLDFLRKYKSRLNFVRVYNRRRELKKLIREDFLLNNNEGDKKEYIIENRKSKSGANIINNRKSIKKIYSFNSLIKIN